MLSTLPRREVGAPATALVKLRVTWHGGKNRPHGKQRFVSLTVPADMADDLPEDSVFKVTREGNRLVYEMVES